MKKLLTLICTLLLKLNVLQITEFQVDITPVTPVYWISNTEIFVNERDRAYIYDVEDREIIKEYEKESGEVYGYQKNEIFICKTENRTRNSIEEYSTHLTKLNLNNEILLDIELKPTLEVLECKDQIILKTIFPIEENFYTFIDDLYPLEEYRQDILSPKLRYLLEVDNFGEYKIKKYTISVL